MTTTLEDRLRRHYDERTAHLPTTGPGLHQRQVNDIELLPSAIETTRRGRLVPVLGAAASLLIVVGLIVIGSRGRNDDPGVSGPSASAGGTTDGSAPSTSASTPEGIAPAATLPDSADLDNSPVTVAGTAPTSWFRLAPDLDIAWYQPLDGAGSSMICWRTPTATDCQPDDLSSMVAPTAGGQTLVIAGGAGMAEVQVQLDDGTGLSAPIVTSQTIIDLGVARFELPPGTTIVSAQAAPAGSTMSGHPDPDEVTGATLPPSGDLIEVPMTIPAGSPLNYWRFLPDLDISERATATGSGTELCWRTPAGTGCLDDTFEGPDVGIVPTDGAVIFLARPRLTPIEPAPSDPLAPRLSIGPPPTTVRVTFTDGTTTDVSLTQGVQFGVSHGRVDVTDDNPITSAQSH